MNRREFLKYCSVLGTSIAVGKTSAYGDWFTNQNRIGFPKGILIIDVHAHPDQLYYLCPKEGPQWENWCAQFCDDSSTLEKIITLGMNGSCFAALGDSGNTILTMDQVMAQLNKVINLEYQGLVRIVRRTKDIPKHVPKPIPHSKPPKNFIPGAILSLEGAIPLGRRNNTVDEELVFEDLDNLYNYGVRMITLMHDQDSQFGYAMRKTAVNDDDTGLTELGKKVIEKMMELGIVVDVAHAHYYTLKDIVEIARENNVPILDSHTSLHPCKYYENQCGGRLRTWDEMEMVASTGGLICTWPLRWERQDGTGRLTIEDWAKENYEIKEKLGSNHIALGTDGGGLLPKLVEGYKDILDLPKLVEAMHKVGFKGNEIEAYMGGNFLRILKRCIG